MRFIVNTTTNISAKMITGVTNASANSSALANKAAGSQDILGFLTSVLQQLQSNNAATPASSASVSPAQSSPSDLKAQNDLRALAEKVAAMLKKQGLSLQQLQNMSPADAAAKIAAMLQQQPGAIPAALLGMSTEDLASKITSIIQKSPVFNAAIRPSLTSDLTAAQSVSTQQVAGTETKADVAKKITDLLEGKTQPDQSGGLTLRDAMVKELKVDIAELQKASGTLDASSLSQLQNDMTAFLQGQGVDAAAIAHFIADMDKVVEAQSAAPVTAAAVASTTQTQDSPAQSAASGTAADAKVSLTTGNVPAATGIKPQDAGKAPSLGDKTDSSGTSIKPQVSGASAESQPQQQAPQQNVTAKVSGMAAVNPALINDLAQNGSDMNGNNAFTGQDGTQTANPAAVLNPVSADALNGNFTNYLQAAGTSSASSPTVQMINLQLQRNINDGIHTMTLQLEPADLGRMDVKLKFDRDGTVRAHMTVDKPETLALLQKDSHHLTRALQQSGLDADDASLSFDLRQHGRQPDLESSGNGNNGRANNSYAGSSVDASAAETSLSAQLAVQSYGYITPGGVNIMV